MNSRVWISSNEAARRARQSDFSEGYLALWAEAGALRARAQRGRFSDDDEGVERILELPNTPDEREKEITSRTILGDSWPAIPKNFWYWINNDIQKSEQHWDTGIFSTTVYYETELGPKRDSQHIKLFGVTFCDDDIKDLLAAGDIASDRGVLPSSAKPNDKKYEEHAHYAAKMIRNLKIKKSEAIRRAVAENPGPSEVVTSSSERAVRASFDIMYYPNGRPIKIDQN